ncbi:YobA family protein [Paenibacillus sp. NPDC057967]|uniref:YobA family protein n=1 Tax=Paenibacillus sp. NPDC057967 TaxID=3346293 RepID=UPI0036DE9F9A
MKKRFWFCLIILIALAGCASSSPDGEGVVFDTDGKQILVLDYSAEPYLGMSWNDIFTDYEGSAIWLNAYSSRFKVGDRVQYWMNGGVNDSYPSQGGARKVKKMGQAPSSSPIVPTTDTSSVHPQQTFTFPDEIKLAYRTLDVVELAEEEPGPDWEKLQSLAFGMANHEAVELHIYNAEADGDGTAAAVHGILQWKDMTDPLLDLLPGMQLDAPSRCIDLCVMQQLVAGTEGAKFLGRLPLMAAGPGLYKYLLVDGNDESQIYSFDAWGRLQEADMDRDGIKEMVLVFEGLGNHSPDLFFLRWQNERMEISQSFLESLSADQGYLAELKRLDDGANVVRVYDLSNEAVYSDYLMKNATTWERIA